MVNVGETTLGLNPTSTPPDLITFSCRSVALVQTVCNNVSLIKLLFRFAAQDISLITEGVFGPGRAIRSLN